MAIPLVIAISTTFHLGKNHHVHKAITCPCTLTIAHMAKGIQDCISKSHMEVINLAIHSLYDFVTQFCISIWITIHPTALLIMMCAMTMLLPSRVHDTSLFVWLTIGGCKNSMCNTFFFPQPPFRALHNACLTLCSWKKILQVLLAIVLNIQYHVVLCMLEYMTQS